MAETTTQEPKTEKKEGAAKTPRPRRSAKSRAVEKLVRSFFEATGAHDVDKAVEYWADDGVEDIVPVGVFRGKKEIEAWARGFLGASSDLEVTLDRVITDDTRAVVEWRFRGTFDGPFQGSSPPARRSTCAARTSSRSRTTRSSASPAYYDSTAFARQIGMMPAQDSGAERAMKSAFNTVTKVRKAIDERRG